MALSQKHSGKILVPWYNSNEWRYVYSLIYSENSTNVEKESALAILRLWKIRMPILFAGVEGTLIILNGMLYDHNELTKEELTSLYGLTIMRFLNLCAAQSDQQGTFFQVAKDRHLPEWLVGIRHDLSHSQKPLSLFMLQKGIEYCFDWLRREYWELQEREIMDYIIRDVAINIENQINLYCAYINSQITQENVGSDIDFFEDLNLNRNSTSNDILKVILTGHKQVIPTALDMIINNGYLFPIAPDDVKSLPIACIKGWEPLFQYLQKNNALIEMVRKLHYVCVNNKDSTVQQASSLWLKIIFESLLHNMKRESDAGEVNGSDSYLMKFEEPSEKFLRELKQFTEEALHTPNLYFTNFLPRLMRLSGQNRDFVQDVDRLIFEYINPHSKLTPGYIPVTIDYAKTIFDATTLEKSNGISAKPKSASCRWQKIEDTYPYEGCPIGILPHQKRDYNPTISF